MSPPRDREQPILIIVKKKKGHGGHHGGAWKVAFADFMTAMMALFLVLWLVTQSSDIKSSIAGYFQDPLGHASEFGNSILAGDGAQAASVRPISDQQIAEFRRDRLLVIQNKLRDKLESTPDLGSIAQHVEVEMTADGLRISLIEDSAGVFFEVGSAVPKPKVAALFQLFGSELADLPFAVRVEGHTDAQPYATEGKYGNWELSTDRAHAARNLLAQGGLGPGQVREVSGHADRDLLDPAHPTHPSNRRVTITLLADPVPESPASASSPLLTPPGSTSQPGGGP